MRIASISLVVAFSALVIGGSPAAMAVPPVDFNRDIRPILSSQCLTCHGPDEESREAGLRLDLAEDACRELDSGTRAIVPGHPDQSELLERITSDDPDLRMPPADFGKALTPEQVDLLRRWIAEGATWAEHWSYARPQRPSPPEVSAKWSDWSVNAIDRFTVARMQEQGLTPSAAADRYALIRRVSLDLTGLPPSVDEADAFVASQDPHAYEQLVDDLLQRPSFGEHWARKWLDLARYADSAGYADDPPRTIWAWRDWVIRSINRNTPFDQFTIEQLAGDLLPSATDEQLIATAFHRNTMTNSEGGTIDEEFRNVAIVDRVNTTFAVWMGTTMACAQCHTHKYDPISQDEFFQVFAILNNTQDEDKKDESPVLPVFSVEQKQQQQKLRQQIRDLQQQVQTPTPELAASQQSWEQQLQQAAAWTVLAPSEVARSSGQPAQVDGTDVLIKQAAERDTYVIDLPLTAGQSLAALQLQTVPHDDLPGGGSGHGNGNFVITGIQASVLPEQAVPQSARYVRVTNFGDNKILSLAEVQVLSQGSNIAEQGTSRQSSTAFGGSAKRAIDGNTSGIYTDNSTTHTKSETDPWWELDLKQQQPISSVSIWNRTDNNLHVRLADFRIELLDEARDVVWERTVASAPNPADSWSVDGGRSVTFQSAFADYHQNRFEPDDVLTGKTGKEDGWAVGGAIDQAHQLTVVPTKAITVDTAATLRVTIEQKSPHQQHLLGRFSIATTADESTLHRSRLSPVLRQILETAADQRSTEQAKQLAAWYREQVAPELADVRRQLATAIAQQDAITPMTTVPVLREITDNRRETLFQFRGNWQATGHKVSEGIPAIFRSSPDQDVTDRLAFARWLVDSNNPLTARVVVNRWWETLFGQGLVTTSEDFGSQGELPSHPQLLDWLATELMRLNWDRKALLKQIVMSATYRQSSVVADGAAEADPYNRWLARGPRVRLSAEMVRDQALAAGGLLSDKLYGPPVNPPQPNLGLRAAFGSSTDWKTSTGEDRYRRGLYTTWRRSNPYPSMATFDAPNREVCTVRRNRTNTPLQSLVTLNDPVYVEAAQSLARNALQSSDQLEDQLTFAFRQCLTRPPVAAEIQALKTLFQDAVHQLADQPEEAMKLATDPLGELPEGITAGNAAAMTVVGNVLLNTDELFLKR